MTLSQRRRWTVAAATLIGASLFGGVLAAVPAYAALPSHVIINEAYLKGGSANAPFKNKFIELYNPTDAPQSLDGWSIQYRPAAGSGPASWTTPLSGTIAPAGYFLIAYPGNADNGVDLPTPDLTGTGNPSGTTGTIYLADTTTAITPPTGNAAGAPNVVDLLGYGTSNTFEAAVAPVTGANTVPNALARTGFVDTDNNAADFTTVTSVTPQGSGGGVGPEPEPTTATIGEIQGTGAASPLVGKSVTTRGVVTAAYPTGGFNGFYIQTPGTGGAIDPATHTASDALFVYGSAATAAVAIGDYVEVTGMVGEYNGLTQITPAAASAVTVLTAQEPAAVTPAKIAWPQTDEARETFEGMLVEPQGAYTVTNTYDTNYYASVGLAAGDEPLISPTEVARPDTAEYAAAVADNAARAVTLDDGATTNFNTAANKAIPLPYLSTTAPVRVGASVTFTKPVVLDYRFGQWNLQPTQQLTVDNAAQVQPATFENTRTQAPGNVGGDIQISSFNVLNYFTTTGADAVAAGATCTFFNDRQGNPITVDRCSTPSVRGAANAENLARQQAKIVAAINGLGAEVVGLEEIENSTIAGTDRDAAVRTLVTALNDALGSDEWAFVPSPSAVPAGEDVIRTALIYKKAAVEPVGDSVIDDDQAFRNARYPLAQAFKPAGGSDDDTFIAIVNHFKSKGDSTPPATGDNANGVQGAFNGDRTRQATALVAFADELTTKLGTDAVFLLGDFNSYTQEDPMKVLFDAGYVDQGSKTGKYTYSFQGASGSLDHILASPAAEKLVSGADIWNINAGESIALEYSRYNYNALNFYDASAYRSSDHDPLVVGIDFDPTVQLNLVNINDFHGRIDQNTVKFAGTVEQLRAQYGEENTLFLSAGDNIGASLFASAVDGDAPTIATLNALDLKTSAAGNHEFDKGFADLTDRVQGLADFSYLGANVYQKGTKDPVLPEYETFEVDGLTVAVVGAVTQETPTLVPPAGVANLDFGDPVDAVNRVAAQLTDGNAANGEADVIIAEYHEGAVGGVASTPPSTLAAELARGGAFADIVNNTSPAVDAIFTAHTHQRYAWDAPVPGAEGKTRPILQTGSYGEFVGQIVLTVDARTGEVDSYTQRNVPRTTTPDADLIGAYPRVEEVNGIVQAALRRAAEIGNQPIGSVTADITTAFSGGSYVDGVYTGGSRDNRAAQSTLGNLVADSLVASLSDPDRGGAQIGVVNPGGLRAELLKGEDGVITYAEANAVLPFANNLGTTTLTGTQFRSLLEEQWQPDGSTRPYLQLGLSANVSYTYDAAAPRGSRITGVWIDGAPIDPAGQYRVGTFSFLLQGGDNFATFTQGADTRDSGLIDRDAWIDYIRAESPLSPSFASRSAQVTGVPATVERGQTITFTVSGLDLTSLGSPANTSLVPSFGDGAKALSPAAVTNGSATVTVTVPADAPAASVLTLTADPSGTVIRVPLMVTASEENGGTGGNNGHTGTGGTGSLPATGNDLGWIGGAVLIALLMIGGGVTAAVVARRRRS